MELREPDFSLTRRQWLGGAAALTAATALPAWAQAPSAWPNVTRLIQSYVDARKVANMVATLGFGEEEHTVIAAGVDSFTAPRRSDADSLYRIYSMTKPVTGMATMMPIDDPGFWEERGYHLRGDPWSEERYS